MLEGRILITGGAGFLARGIYRRARRESWPAQWTCLSRDDSKHAILQARYPEVACVLGDVARMGIDELALLFRGHDLVIHAAASKYVDRAELAARETVHVNVVGSMNVAQAAILARVTQVVGISTDKAVQPVNVYGMSKAIMERIFQEAGQNEYGTEFVVMRYGNVIGSTGSVIPMWRRQLAEGKPIAVTDPTMTRYWMSVDEAVDAIVHAVSFAPNAHVVIPRPRAMQMGAIAAALAGTRWNGEGFADESRIRIVGLRPGEKRHESLMHAAESVRVEHRDRPYSWIAPPGTPLHNREEFELVSDRPEAGWIMPEEMLELIVDAENV